MRRPSGDQTGHHAPGSVDTNRDHPPRARSPSQIADFCESRSNRWMATWCSSGESASQDTPVMSGPATPISRPARLSQTRRFAERPGCWYTSVPVSDAEKGPMPYVPLYAESSGRRNTSPARLPVESIRCATSPPSRQNSRWPSAYTALESFESSSVCDLESSDVRYMPFTSLPPRTKNTKWRPSGRNCGQRCEVSRRASSSTVTPRGVPPDADTAYKAPLIYGAKTIVSPLHVPPRPFGASQITREPCAPGSVRFNFPPAKNASERPSADQKGHPAPSVPGRSCESSASIGRSHRCEIPMESDPTNTIRFPSGE